MPGRVQKLQQRLELVRVELRPRGSEGVEGVFQRLLELAERNTLRECFPVPEYAFREEGVRITLGLVRFEVTFGECLPLSAEENGVPVLLPQPASILPDDA